LNCWISTFALRMTFLLRPQVADGLERVDHALLRCEHARDNNALRFSRAQDIDRTRY
jgi:hypothetical protein